MNDYKNTMLISPKKVKESGELNLNVDDSTIGSSIRTAQNVYLTDVIGNELVERIQELVYNKIKSSGTTIDDEPAYKVLLDEYLTPVLISKTIVDIALRITFKIRNMGVVQNSDVNVNSVSIDDVKYVQNYQETMYNHYLNRMADFMCANKDAFPESKFDCGCKPKGKYANTNLWLG